MNGVFKLLGFYFPPGRGNNEVGGGICKTKTKNLLELRYTNE